MELAHARQAAADVVALLAPACRTTAIAGSIRRGKADCKDIELVVVAKPLVARPVFGETTSALPPLEALVAELVCTRQLEFDPHLKRVGTWAESVFTESTPASIVAHLRREVEELAAITHLGPPEGEEEEAADCLLLLLHLAHRRGYSLLAAADRKFAENKLRRWGKPDTEGVVEHERDQEG